MPINMNDPRIKAEWVPPTITAVGTALRQRYGTGADSIGTQGNNVHNSGYHRSENWIRNSPDSRDHDQDYSIQGELNRSQNRDAVCALDFTPGSWGTQENRRRMIELTTRVRTAALAHDPRLSDVFEFAGTLNGTNVVTFRCSDGASRSPFDSSHLDHMHASFFRSRALNNHDGFIDVLLGDDDMAGERADAYADSLAWGINHFTDPITGANRPIAEVQWEVAREAFQQETKASLDELKARPAVPPITLTPAQVTDMANLVANNLATNATFLTSLANAVLDEDHRRSES